MPKPNPSLLRPDSEGSKYLAWTPHLGTFDVRQMELFDRTETSRSPTYDLDLDTYTQGDIYEKTFSPVTLIFA